MKQKKIIVPILTLAVMLLMVGGVYAVFSSTQPEKSIAENVRDTTDQDYEKGLTEEFLGVDGLTKHILHLTLIGTCK